MAKIDVLLFYKSVPVSVVVVVVVYTHTLHAHNEEITRSWTKKKLDLLGLKIALYIWSAGVSRGVKGRWSPADLDFSHALLQVSLAKCS